MVITRSGEIVSESKILSRFEKPSSYCTTPESIAHTDKKFHLSTTEAYGGTVSNQHIWQMERQIGYGIWSELHFVEGFIYKYVRFR